MRQGHAPAGNVRGTAGASWSVTNDLVTARVPAAGAAVEPTWEMTWLSHIDLPAGQDLPHDPGPCWIFVAAGEITLGTASGVQALRTGDAVLIDARTAYRVTAPGPDPAQLVVADLRVLMTPQRLPSPMAICNFAAFNAGVAALVTMCPLDHECPPMTFATGYGNLIGAAMVAAWKARRARQGCDPSADVPDDAVAMVVAAVTARPGEAWTVERMARLAHLSRSALGDRFRRSLGLGPSELLREVRMREARRLLRDPSRSVEHVAYAVGYGSTAAFSRAFSSQHGMGPQAWRAALRARGAQRGEDDAGRGSEHRADQQRARDPVRVQ